MIFNYSLLSEGLHRKKQPLRLSGQSDELMTKGSQVTHQPSAQRCVNEQDTLSLLLSTCSAKENFPKLLKN